MSISPAKLLSLFVIPALMVAQSSSVTGRWFASADFFGTALNFSLELSQQGNKITGNFDGDKLEGTLNGSVIHFLAKDEQGGTEELTGTVQAGFISGTITITDSDNNNHPTAHPFKADQAAARHTGSPQRYEFTPSTFNREFSAATKPVLSLFPGDTVHTTTVDAGGTDEKGVMRVLGGNLRPDPSLSRWQDPETPWQSISPASGSIVIGPSVTTAWSPEEWMAILR